MNKTSLKRPPLYIFLLLAALGGLVCIVIALFGASSTPESQAFIKSADAIPWIFINVVLFALYPIFFLLAWTPLYRYRKYGCNKKKEIIASSILITGLFFFPFWIGNMVGIVNFPPLEYVQGKILIFRGAGFFGSALPMAIGIWTIQAAIRGSFGVIKARGVDIKKYIGFRDYLQQFLMALGILLSLFILQSAGYRSAAIASGATTAASYPSVLLLLVGAYFTFLIAILYFPAYLDLVSAGKRLLNACFPLPAPGSVSWTEQYAKRKSLEDLLELKVTGEQRFLTSVSLLAPFVSSILTLLLAK